MAGGAEERTTAHDGGDPILVGSNKDGSEEGDGGEGMKESCWGQVDRKVSGQGG